MPVAFVGIDQTVSHPPNGGQFRDLWRFDARAMPGTRWEHLEALHGLRGSSCCPRSAHTQNTIEVCMIDFDRPSYYLVHVNSCNYMIESHHEKIVLLNIASFHLQYSHILSNLFNLYKCRSYGNFI